MIKESVIAALEADYRAGYGVAQAADRNAVSRQSVRKRYARFAAAGIPRGPKRHAWPRYDGPAWIGKAIPDGEAHQR